MFNFVLLLPLLSSLLLCVNKLLGTVATSVITVTFMLVTFLTSTYIFYCVALTGESLSYFMPIQTWFDCELFAVSIGGYYDALSGIMLCVVTFVSLAVHLYSLEYMKNDMHLQRFLCYLSMFTFL